MALICLAPSTMGAPLVPDVLNATGAATTFQVFGEGFAIEGAPYEWNDVCTRCLIRITITEGVFFLLDADGGSRPLDPGQYELREYRGLFMLSQNAPHDFTVELHGAGKIVKIN